MPDDPFVRGFVAGLVTAGVLGLVGGRIRWLGGKDIVAFFKPQAVVMKTNKSPWAAFLAMVSNILFLALVVVVLYAVARIIVYSAA